MVTVGMNYQVVPGKQGEFEAVFDKVLGVMERMGGHQRTALYRQVNDPTAYLILSVWTDRAAFEAFTSSSQFRGVTDWGKAGILATRPRHDVFESGAPNIGASGACPATSRSQN